MLCDNCKKLSTTLKQKACIRCQNNISINISILCEFCSTTQSQCSACLKKIVKNSDKNKTKGCGCRRGG